MSEEKSRSNWSANDACLLVQLYEPNWLTERTELTLNQNELTTEQKQLAADQRQIAWLQNMKLKRELFEKGYRFLVNEEGVEQVISPEGERM